MDSILGLKCWRQREMKRSLIVRQVFFQQHQVMRKTCMKGKVYYYKHREFCSWCKWSRQQVISMHYTTLHLRALENVEYCCSPLKCFFIEFYILTFLVINFVTGFPLHEHMYVNMLTVMYRIPHVLFLFINPYVKENCQHFYTWFPFNIYKKYEHKVSITYFAKNLCKNI